MGVHSRRKHPISPLYVRTRIFCRRLALGGQQGVEGLWKDHLRSLNDRHDSVAFNRCAQESGNSVDQASG